MTIEDHNPSRYGPPTDPALVDRLRNGDEEAWRTAFEIHANRVNVHLKYVLGRRGVDRPRDFDEIVHDAVQDTFCYVKQRFPNDYEHRGVGTFRRYLYTVAEGKLVDQFRRRRIPMQALDDDAVCDPRNDIDQFDRQECVKTVLATLEHRFGQESMRIFLARVEGGESVAQIAGNHDMSPKQVSQLLWQMKTSASEIAERYRPFFDL